MPRLVVISTGGTIATTADADGTLRPARTGAELAAGVDVGAAIEVVDLLSLDSSQLTPADWLQISGAVRAAVDGGADGVVVTHGTDTLEETALWLDLTYDGAVPVVLTGAARPADDADPDGPGNLRDALTAAASPQCRQAGVLISFAGVLRPPLGTTKLGGAEVFGGAAPVGTVAGSTVQLTGGQLRPYLGHWPGPVDSAPRVDIVSAYPGADGTAIEAFAAAGARALVLEAVGSGNAGTAVVQAVSRVCASGVAVAVTTRVPFGHAAGGYGPGQDLIDAGAVMVPRLRAGQARVLLIAALGAGLPLAEVVGRWG